MRPRQLALVATLQRQTQGEPLGTDEVAKLKPRRRVAQPPPGDARPERALLVEARGGDVDADLVDEVEVAAVPGRLRSGADLLAAVWHRTPGHARGGAQDHESGVSLHLDRAGGDCSLGEFGHVLDVKVEVATATPLHDALQAQVRVAVWRP